MDLEEEIGIWRCFICIGPLKEGDEYVEVAFLIGKMEYNAIGRGCFTS